MAEQAGELAQAQRKEHFDEDVLGEPAKFAELAQPTATL